MINKPSIGIGLPIDVINRIQSILKSFINSDSVTLGLSSAVVRHQSFIHLGLLVDLTQLVLFERFLTALAAVLLFGFAYKRNAVGLLILTVYSIVVT
jgi:hypothetical protein